MIDIQSLRYALTLAEELHFGRAARAHYISPQPFGRRIQALERQLGCQLFSRTSRQVQLTPAGRQFLRRASQVLAELDLLVGAVGTEPSSSGLRIGVLGYGLADRWPVVRGLLAEDPALTTVDYVELTWADQYDAVRSGAVDVAIVHDVGGADDLAVDVVMATERCAVVPVESELASAEHLASSDLQGRRCVLPVGQPGLTSWLGEDLAPARVTVRSPASIPSAVVASGAGGIHGEPATRFLAHPGVRFVPLEGPPAVVSLVSRAEDRRPLVSAFRSLVDASRSLAEALEVD
jgi:DNA-binding transcriptional LysR family regulator